MDSTQAFVLSVVLIGLSVLFWCLKVTHHNSCLVCFFALGGVAVFYLAPVEEVA